jgi:hypothetical protein
MADEPGSFQQISRDLDGALGQGSADGVVEHILLLNNLSAENAANEQEQRQGPFGPALKMAQWIRDTSDDLNATAKEAATERLKEYLAAHKALCEAQQKMQTLDDLSAGIEQAAKNKKKTSQLTDEMKQLDAEVIPAIPQASLMGNFRNAMTMIGLIPTLILVFSDLIYEMLAIEQVGIAGSAAGTTIFAVGISLAGIVLLGATAYIGYQFYKGLSEEERFLNLQSHAADAKGKILTEQLDHEKTMLDSMWQSLRIMAEHHGVDLTDIDDSIKDKEKDAITAEFKKLQEAADAKGLKLPIPSLDASNFPSQKQSKGIKIQATKPNIFWVGLSGFTASFGLYFLAWKITSLVAGAFGTTSAAAIFGVTGAATASILLGPIPLGLVILAGVIAIGAVTCGLMVREYKKRQATLDECKENLDKKHETNAETSNKINDCKSMATDIAAMRESLVSGAAAKAETTEVKADAAEMKAEAAEHLSAADDLREQNAVLLSDVEQLRAEVARLRGGPGMFQPAAEGEAGGPSPEGGEKKSPDDSADSDTTPTLGSGDGE